MATIDRCVECKTAEAIAKTLISFSDCDYPHAFLIRVLRHMGTKTPILTPMLVKAEAVWRQTTVPLQKVQASTVRT